MAGISRASMALLITANLNLSPGSYSSVSNASDPLYQAQEILDAIDVADTAVIGAIYDNPNHRLRPNYLTIQSITDGAEITKSFNGGVKIDGEPGKMVDPNTLWNLRSSNFTPALTTNKGYFTIMGNQFFFTGSAATVEVFNPTLSAGGNGFFSPDEYQSAILAGALSILYTKDGTNIEAANHYSTQYTAMLKMVSQGTNALPSVQMQ